MINLKDRSKRLLLAVIAGTVVGVGAFGYLIYSDWTTIDDTVSENQTLADSLRKTENELKRLGGIEDGVLELRERVKEYVTILPDDSEIHAFVDKLTEFASEAGVTVTGLDDTAAKQRRQRKEKTREAFDRVTYKLKLTATTDGFVKFIDAFENRYDRFVNIPSFKIKASDDKGKAGSSGPRRNEIEMEIETYVYNARTRDVDLVAIPKEAEKLQRLQEAGRLDAKRGDLGLKRYTYKETPGRRDPFTDPRLALAVNGQVSEDTRRTQESALEDLKSEIGIIQGAIDSEAKLSDAVQLIRAQEATNDRIRGLDALVTRYVEEKFFTVPDYVASFKENVETPLRKLRETRALNAAAMAVGKREIEERVVAIEAAFREEKFDRVVVLSQDLDQLRNRVQGTPETYASLFARADEAKRQSSLHLGFADMDLKITGVICFGNDPKQAVVTINNRNFSPGELVDSGLVITGITKHEVTFDFQGIKVARRIGGS